MIKHTGAILLLIATGANAAPRDPNWPCQQIKVPALSLASVWSGPPVDPTQAAWKEDPQVAGLVAKLTLRRENLDQAGALIHGFAQQAGGDMQPRLLNMLAGLYTVLDDERSAVIAGLDRFGGRQKELAANLRADNEKLHALQNDAGADPNTVQQMAQKVMWEAQVFQDRRQAISYACDAPTKIEQRLFALARLIQQELD